MGIRPNLYQESETKFVNNVHNRKKKLTSASLFVLILCQKASVSNVLDFARREAEFAVAELEPIRFESEFKAHFKPLLG